MFVSPLASIVPMEVAAAALVVVGAMMFSQIRHIDISDFTVALPVVLTVAVMPLSYSIANGIGADSSPGWYCGLRPAKPEKSARCCGSWLQGFCSTSSGVPFDRHNSAMSDSPRTIAGSPSPR